VTSFPDKNDTAAEIETVSHVPLSVLIFSKTVRSAAKFALDGLYRKSHMLV
jgi:hypothetical protein